MLVMSGCILWLQSKQESISVVYQVLITLAVLSNQWYILKKVWGDR